MNIIYCEIDIQKMSLFLITKDWQKYCNKSGNDWYILHDFNMPAV